MSNEDEATIEGILLDGDYYDDPQEIYSRPTQEIKNGRYIVLDISNLELDEISENIELLDQLRVLDIRDNQINNLPSEIRKMKNLKEIRLAGNSIQSLPYGTEHIKFDLMLPTRSEEEEDTTTLKYGSSQTIRHSDKVCTWCNVAAGYTRQSQRSEGTWGFSKHYSRILVCLNCGYMHSFHTGRSII